MMYQYGVLSKLAWPFLSQDNLPLSLAHSLTTIANRFLKSWIGLFKRADTGVLYRSKPRFGLGLTSVSCFFKRMNVTKCLLLKHSDDKDIKDIYNHYGVKKNFEIKKLWYPNIKGKDFFYTLAIFIYLLFKRKSNLIYGRFILGCYVASLLRYKVIYNK